MLTIQEQDEVIKFVKKMLKNERTRRSKIERFVMSDKAAKESEQRDFEELRYVLKDLG